MAGKNKAPLGIELIKRGVATQEDIEKAIEYQKNHPNKKIRRYIKCFRTM